MHAPQRSGPALGAEVVVDKYGAVAVWNGDAEAMLGYPSVEVLGRLISDVLSVDLTFPMDGAEAGSGGTSETPIMARCRDGRGLACSARVRATSYHGSPAWYVQLAAQGRDGSNPDGQDMDEAVLQSLYNESPVGLYLYGTDLRLRRYNPAAKGAEAIFHPDPLGLLPSERWPDSNAAELEKKMADVLATGTPLLDFEKYGYAPGIPDREYVFNNAVFRLRDADGYVLGLANIAVDITNQRMAERRLELLARASAVLGTTLDVVETGQQLAEATAHGFADVTTVDLLDSVLTGGDPGPHANRSELRRIAIQHGPGSPDHAGDPLVETHTFPLPSTHDDLSTWEPGILPAEPPAGGTGPSPVVLVVPLRVRDTVLGVVQFYRTRAGALFEDADVATARDLTSRAAIALDNARRYVKERLTVKYLQRQLRPESVPRHSAVETAHHFASARAGADWYDVIPLSAGRVALVVGTSAGDGLSAAAAVGRLRAAVHTLAELDPAPDELLARLNTLVRRIGNERDRPDGAAGERHCDAVAGTTLLYAVYDPTTGQLKVSSAGHPAPVVALPQGTTCDLADFLGPPLGSRDDPRFRTAELEVPPESTLALYTPGLLGSGDATASMALLKESVSPTHSVSLDLMCRGAVERLLPEDHVRGAVLLLARTRRLGEDQVVTWTLPHDPAVVATARALVESQLQVWDLEAHIFATQLVASELVTNAIRYAQGTITLRLLRDQTLTCEVSDGSTTAPHLRYARTEDEGGRGLFLVAQVTQRWGSRYTENGKTIWTEQSMVVDSH